MDSLSCWLLFCSILTLIGEFNAYVLFAANVDDFRNIARKIVPETLADKLARLASVPAKQKSRDITESEYEYGSETELDKEESESVDNSNLRNVNSMYIKDWETRVNFEELVERVKDRLANEMKEEIQKRIGKAQNSEHENRYINKKTQHMASEINNANEDTFGYNTDRGYSEKDGYNSKKYIDGRFTKVTRNYEPITSYQDKYDVSEKKYPNKYVKPKYIDYQENHKLNYDDGDTQKHKSGNQNDYKTNIKGKDNSNDRDIYVYDNYDANANKNTQPGIENGPKGSSLYDMYHKKDAQKYEEKKYDNPKEINPIKIHNHFKQTTPDYNKFDNKETLYNQFDLISKTKNDSYEDYVVPNKEENVFASEEISKNRPKTDSSNTKYNQKNSRFDIKNAKANVKPFSEWKVDRYNGKPDETNESVEIKAKTESLWFDDHSKDTEIISEATKGKGTMIPTRETYKMSSPNYYISLPTVAERYDSEEPLPERDRERQIIKHFLNPPASINKKVRLLK